MRETGQANNPVRHAGVASEGPLEIEIIRDADYRKNDIYCSWQEIVSGGSGSMATTPDSCLGKPRLAIATR